MIIIVKFIVLFGCIRVLSALQTYYCEICANHTLCKYNISGPSATCNSYDKASLLSDVDIKQLVHNINERRNFVAMGYSKVLPQAANMKRIHWSAELANFAQRWADQCDPSLHPDREDDCRDLESTPVGQNIASVSGTSPGLNVKSFVEMWFIQSLDYSGTVTYYNRSQDYKANYFTQLIWADTEFVGCGKVKFFITEKQMMVERIVCNFAPRGNIDGKFVYSIGYSGTQCPTNMKNDDTYKGLCTYKHPEEITKLTTPKATHSNLLRILNLSNDPVKQEIDPSRYQLIQNKVKKKRQRNQKTRHILIDYHNDAMRRPLSRKQNMWKNPVFNMSRDMHEDDYIYRQDPGRSQSHQGHDHHGHDHQVEPEPQTIYPPTNYFDKENNENLRRYDYTKSPIYLISSTNPRKNFQNQCCTRRCPTQQCVPQYQPTTCCTPATACQTFTNPIIPTNWCTCTRVCPPAYNTPCPPVCITPDPCICGRRDASHNKIPNMIRSGEHDTTYEIPSPEVDSEQSHNTMNSKSYQNLHEKETANPYHERVDDDEIHSKYDAQDRDYLYRDSRLRKKRQRREIVSLMPFWTKSNLNSKQLNQTNTFKDYTTLAYKNNRTIRSNDGVFVRSTSRHPIKRDICCMVTVSGKHKNIIGYNKGVTTKSNNVATRKKRLRTLSHHNKNVNKLVTKDVEHNHRPLLKVDEALKISHLNDSDENRIKRHGDACDTNENKIMSYADLFYLILNSFLKNKQDKMKHCQCNGTNTNSKILFMFCYITILHVIVNLLCN